MKNPPVVKLSSVDLKAPDSVFVEFQLCHPPERRGGTRIPPVPFFRTIDIVECERKAAELNRARTTYVFTTVWCDKLTKRKVNKLSLLRKGTTRTYTVCVPWVEGVTHETVTNAILNGLRPLYEEYGDRDKLSVTAERGKM